MQKKSVTFSMKQSMAESKCDWAKLIFDGATTQTSTLPKLDDWVNVDDGDEEEGGDDWESHIKPPQLYYHRDSIQNITAFAPQARP